jgi:hypothetical protein
MIKIVKNVKKNWRHSNNLRYSMYLFGKKIIFFLFKKSKIDFYVILNAIQKKIKKNGFSRLKWA